MLSYQIDVPFTNGVFSVEGAFMNVNVDDIECDESILVFNILRSRFYQFQKCNLSISTSI